ncbi:RBR-type E3 ubiquitin transferase [Favolaschia claudopus]|uniref:RBR-type E3 ubiquitin transferase n=1 Tax=Favolaschia claudopus TaxID=2862362 RepID=A0AAW0AZC7_9AGAR
MGNCMSNTGSFEPPGSAALKDYVTYHSEATDPVKAALRRAEERAREAEKRNSTPQVAAAPPPKPKGPKCSVCFKHCQISVNPWQRTKGDLMVAELSDDSDDEEEDGSIAEVPINDARRPARTPRKPAIHGFQLQSCKHYFCGACLAQHIYRCLNLNFDPAQYGKTLKEQSALTTGRRADFPISCPTCQVKPGEQPVEISDMTARLVLGDPNMDEWNHARFLSTLNLIYCPHRGCDETFDADDVAPAPSGVSHAKSLVQCPRCRGSLCKSCKVVWHDKMTCEQYQALPLTERAPEDVAFVNLALQEKWRRCPHHISCICGNHFCYSCGAKFEHTNGKYRCTGGAGCKVWDEQMLLDARG